MTNNPTMKVYGVCDFCGYDAEVAVKYQIKQNEEVLSPEEYDDEVAFYLFESHADFCKPMAKAVGGYDEDEEGLYEDLEKIAEAIRDGKPVDSEKIAEAMRRTDAKALAQALEQACDPPCVPRPMLGMSDWKNLGFNTACKCAEALHRAGFRHMSDYLHNGIWPTEED